MSETGKEATSTYKLVAQCPENISEASYKCVCLTTANATSIVNMKKLLNIVVEDVDPHIIGITESWANISNAELGLQGHAMFRRDRI